MPYGWILRNPQVFFWHKLYMDRPALMPSPKILKADPYLLAI